MRPELAYILALEAYAEAILAGRVADRAYIGAMEERATVAAEAYEKAANAYREAAQVFASAKLYEAAEGLKALARAAEYAAKAHAKSAKWAANTRNKKPSYLLPYGAIQEMGALQKEGEKAGSRFKYLVQEVRKDILKGLGGI